MADKMRVGALILAAGLSSRMDGFKPLLTIRGKKLIEHVADLFKEAGIDDLVTVVGHRSAELIPVVEAVSSRWVVNLHYSEGMFSSVQCGVKVLRGSCDAFFLLPVDIPLVSPSTISALLDGLKKNPAAPVCYPQFQSRRGHPPLVATSLIDTILEYDGQGGMRGMLRGYEGRAMTVEVEDRFIIEDIDTRADLVRLKKEYRAILETAKPFISL